MAKNFSESEVELKDVVDTLQRAISIFRDAMTKNPAFCRSEATHAI